MSTMSKEERYAQCKDDAELIKSCPDLSERSKTLALNAIGTMFHTGSIVNESFECSMRGEMSKFADLDAAVDTFKKRKKKRIENNELELKSDLVCHQIKNPAFLHANMLVFHVVYGPMVVTYVSTGSVHVMQISSGVRLAFSYRQMCEYFTTLVKIE